MSANKWNRREFLEYASKGGLVLGAGMTSFGDFLRAQTAQDEHFFIFLELRGGVHWMLATDGRDLSKLPLDDPKRCLPYKITDQLPTEEEYKQIVNNDDPERVFENGDFILLPYEGELNDCYKKGVSNFGNEYVLGWCGYGLEPYVNDIAVIKGFHCQGSFHGIGNSNTEIFGGHMSADSPHVASILATLLEKDRGQLLLDNLVFENGTFVTGADGALAKPPIRLDGESLAYLIANADSADTGSAERRFANARMLAEGLGQATGLSDLHRKVFGSYVSAMGDAKQAREKLILLKDSFLQKDASLDLDLQFDTALTLFKNRLTRVATLCLGTANGKNSVDGFGWFDAHRGTYHVEAGAGTANTMRHHLNVKDTMAKIGSFIAKLKSTPFTVIEGEGENAREVETGKTMFDVTTVVIGTEFARPSNFAGNEASGFGGATAFGSGHNLSNNNYVLFGKGVRGGTWVGQGDPIRQTGFKVDMTTVGAENANDIKMTPTAFTPQEFGGQAMEQIDYNSDLRAFRAKDLARTVMDVAGYESRFGEAYKLDDMASAKSIKCVVKK